MKTMALLSVEPDVGTHLSADVGFTLWALVVRVRVLVHFVVPA
ncbi:hypothetical protein J2Y41_001043 [Arthrobacter sp. 1088]|nr:hypothetical protein [Arthrobacter sp. 1088]